MAIKVRLTDTESGHFIDALTGISLDNENTTSGDLSGKDCRNVIKGISDGILELISGYLGPAILEGTVGADINYDFLAQADRKVNEICIKCDGPGDIEIIFDGNAGLGVIVRTGESFSYTFDYPISTAKVALDSGVSADFRMVVK